MKIHLIKDQTIDNYCLKNARARISFDIWKKRISEADWEKPEDIISNFGKSADLLGNGSNRVVFDIGGNNFRMICKYGFGGQMVHLFIFWIGTHAEYTTLCNANEQYHVAMY